MNLPCLQEPACALGDLENDFPFPGTRVRRSRLRIPARVRLREAHAEHAHLAQAHLATVEDDGKNGVSDSIHNIAYLPRAQRPAKMMFEDTFVEQRMKLLLTHKSRVDHVTLASVMP